MSYYTKITKAGLAAITAAMNNNTKVPITYMAFGDGNGYIPEPDEDASSLVNEVYRVGLNKVEVHSKNPNWLVCEAIIPSAVGGFNIREVALYDNTGNTMLAIASYPPTYKPTLAEGSAKIQTIRIIIQVDNSGNFELIVDPDVVLATIDYVNQKFSEIDISNIMIGNENLNNYLGKFNKCFNSLAEAEAYIPKLGEVFYIKELFEGFGGGFFVAVDKTQSDGGFILDSKSEFSLKRQLIGQELQITWWYKGNWDDAIESAVNFVGNRFGGGELYLPLDKDVYIYRTHRVDFPIRFIGSNVGLDEDLVPKQDTGVVYIADGITAFKFGLKADTLTRMFGGGVKGVTALGIGYVQGNIAEYFGSQNTTFGYQTKTTIYAGAKNAAGQNMSNCLCENGYAFAPFVFEENCCVGLGYALKNIAANYALEFKNNLIRWCKVGVYNGAEGIPTTIQLQQNTIERCSIGVHVNYPSSMITISDNVIEANYAGCDILLFNAADTIDINRNYFEASPDNIVIRGDSSAYIASNLKIYKNTGVKLYIRQNCRNIILEDNWLVKVEFAPFVNGYVKDVTLKNNYNSGTENPFVPTNENFVLNSVAMLYKHEIKFIDDHLQAGGSTLPDGAFSLATPSHNLNKYFATTSNTEVKAIEIIIPNIYCDAIFNIEILKYAGETLNNPSSYRENILHLRRLPNGNTEYSLINKVNHTFAETGGIGIPEGTVTITGDAQDTQTINLNFATQIGGGNTGHHIISTRYISNIGYIEVK